MKYGLIIISMLICSIGLTQDTLKIRNLDTATVTARKALVTARIDGFLYDARQAAPVAGQTAIDLLRVLPGVQVDQDGAPTMRGSSQIKVFIDGKPSTAYANSITDALRQIPSDLIAKVEIITHPSAKYDAEGVDGVINIFTKRRLTNGSSGSINQLVQNRFSQLSGNLAWRQQQWIINPDAGIYHSSNEVLNSLDRTDSALHLSQDGTTKSTQKGHYGGINIAYLVDTLTNINFSYRYGSNSFNKAIVLDNVIEVQDNFVRYTDNPSERYIHTLNGGLLTRSRDRSTEFNFLGSWFYQGHVSDYMQRLVRDRAVDHTESNHLTVGNSELALQADLTKNFGNSMTLETGVKTTFRKYTNKSVYVPDDGRADDFWFRWANIAAYVNYTINVKEWQLRIGGRYEQTHWPLHFHDTTLNLPDYRYFLPNLIISRTFSPAHSLSAGYARKLIRPYINFLNPVVNYIDSLNLEYGNPDVRPALSNNYDLTYTFHKKDWLLSTSFFINQTRNSIEAIRISKPGGVVSTTYGNVADYYVTGGTVQLSHQGKLFSFNTNHTIRRVDFPLRAGVVLNSRFGLTYKPGHGLTVSAFLNFNTRETTLQGRRTGWQKHTLTMNKALLDGKLAVSLQLDNLFTPYRFVRDESTGAGFRQITKNRYITRYFQLGITYKFGKKEIRLPAAKAISNEN